MESKKIYFFKNITNKINSKENYDGQILYVKEIKSNEIKKYIKIILAKRIIKNIYIDQS